MTKILLILVYSILLASCHSKSIGTSNRTRFTSVDRLNTNTVWINNQFSAKQCLCTVLSQYNTALLFNSYSNGSCQLFFSLPYTYTMEYNVNSTLILLSPLPPVNQAPCCSNLTWLITRIKNSTLPVISHSSPTYMVIDDLDYLAVISYNDKLYRFNRTTMSLILSRSIASACVSLSYYNRQYFVGCGSDTSSRQYVLSTSTLASITNISMPDDPRDVVFIRNGSVMIASIAGNNQLAFYNVTSPTSYRLTTTINTTGAPYSIYPVNDAFLHIAMLTANTPIYTLTYNSTRDRWSWNTMPATINAAGTFNFQTTFDACGRMWVSQRGYGIRIFDSTGTKSLYNWTLSNGLNSIVLNKYFDLYAADFTNSKIFAHRPNITQCTS